MCPDHGTITGSRLMAWVLVFTNARHCFVRFATKWFSSGVVSRVYGLNSPTYHSTLLKPRRHPPQFFLVALHSLNITWHKLQYPVWHPVFRPVSNAVVCSQKVKEQHVGQTISLLYWQLSLCTTHVNKQSMHQSALLKIIYS